MCQQSSQRVTSHQMYITHFRALKLLSCLPQPSESDKPPRCITHLRALKLLSCLPTRVIYSIRIRDHNVSTTTSCIVHALQRVNACIIASERNVGTLWRKRSDKKWGYQLARSQLVLLVAVLQMARFWLAHNPYTLPHRCARSQYTS